MGTSSMDGVGQAPACTWILQTKMLDLEWADQFAVDKYEGSTLDLYTWNDMNEPSVFNGPEVSMRKDVKAVNGQEQGNGIIYTGFYQQMATAEGQIRRSNGRSERPFVLSQGHSFLAVSAMVLYGRGIMLEDGIIWKWQVRCFCPSILTAYLLSVLMLVDFWKP